MEIEELKAIPITSLLSHLGIEPVTKNREKVQWLYHSPLREDRTPSFSVSRTKNLWNDLALEKGGNVIDLAIQLNGNCTFHKAAEWLEEQYKAFGTGITSEQDKSRYHQSVLNPRRPTESDIRNVKVIELEHRALLGYIMKRGIPIDIGKRYCKEVHYTVFNKEYFGLCFMNIVGGMEIRNVYFKGCYGEKAPSVIPVDKSSRTESCCVFEGFMDFLSYNALRMRNAIGIIPSEPCDCIVLNSTSIVAKAISFIKVYNKAYCYLDNDAAGRNAFKEVLDSMQGAVIDMSSAYSEFNDLNDYLMGKKKIFP